MRILIDGTTLCDAQGGTGAGIEHYTWQIVRAMFEVDSNHEFFVFVPPQLNRVRESQLIEGCKNVQIVRTIGPKISFISRHFLLPIRFWLKRPDIVFSPSGQLPLAWRGASAITIHDLAIYLHPEWFPEGQDFSIKTIVPRSIEKATGVIAVSKATQENLIKQFPVAQDKTHVVYEGVRPPHEALESMDESDTRFPFDHDYVLYLGTLEPRKNLVHAMRAFHRFLTSRPELVGNVRFVLAGKSGWKTKEIEEEFLHINREWKKQEPNGVIQFLGPVTEEEKWKLLARAGCLLFPSLDEGFGLPVLEAMSVGTPVITTELGAIPEVAGDAALYVKPDDIGQMSLSIAQCLLVPEGVKEFRMDGFKRAQEFTWERAAKETLGYLEEIVKSKNRAK